MEHSNKNPKINLTASKQKKEGRQNPRNKQLKQHKRLFIGGKKDSGKRQMQTVLYQPSRSSAGGGRTEHSGGAERREETADRERKQVRPRSVARRHQADVRLKSERRRD